MGFFKTLFNGYRIMYNDLVGKHPDLLPRCFTGCGTGLMMIGSAVMAKTAIDEDIDQLIADCDAAIEAAKKSQEGDKKIEKTKRVLKARATKGLKIVKVFHKGILCEVAGATGVGIGYGMAERGKHRALKAVGAIGAAFASYRAAVKEDLGEEADNRYLAGKSAIKRSEKVNKKTGEITEEFERAEDGLTINKDPSAFRFWFSEETCPSLWFDNLDLRTETLKHVEDGMTLRFQTTGHISLNDMRREFGGLTPEKMDVDIGGIFGKVLDPKKPIQQQTVNLHFSDDKDFMQGRTNGCWIIFECDEKPIVGRIGKRPVKL